MTTKRRSKKTSKAASRKLAYAKVLWAGAGPAIVTQHTDLAVAEHLRDRVDELVHGLNLLQSWTPPVDFSVDFWGRAFSLSPLIRDGLVEGLLALSPECKPRRLDFRQQGEFCIRFESLTPQASSGTVPPTLPEKHHHRRRESAEHQALAERNRQLEAENSLLQEQIEWYREKLAALGSEYGGGVLRREAATDSEPPELPTEQRAVLQAIRELPADAFSHGRSLLKKLDQQPMTRAFAESLAAVLREKEWGAVCEKVGCGAAAAIVWIPSKRYSSGGFAAYSHRTDPGKNTKHQCLTKIRPLTLCRRTDHRLSQSE